MLEFHAHPLARPLVKDDSYTAMRETIRVTGQLMPLLTIPGKTNGDQLVWDGVRRLEIFRELKIPADKIRFQETRVEESRLPELVAEVNFQRWDLDPAQRAAYCVRYVLPSCIALAKERQRLGGRPGSADGVVNGVFGAEKGEKNGSAKLRYHSTVPGTGDGGRVLGEAAGGNGKASEHAALLCHVKPRSVEALWKVSKIAPDIIDRVLERKFNVNQATGELRRRQNIRASKELARENRSATKNATWEITTGDCLKILPTLKRRHYRLIFVDPPYNIGMDYGDGARADRLPPLQFSAWCDDWMHEAAELLTTDGSMWIVINDEWAPDFIGSMRAIGLHQRAWIKWYETFGINCSNNFNRTSRHLLYFVRDPKQFIFNREIFSRPSARQTLYADHRAAPGGKLWDDVWDIPRLTGTCAERIAGFPTQLPLNLVRPIVEGCSEPGDRVLDFFSGSATTGAACIATGRKFAGIEIKPNFVELSRARLIKQQREGQ